MLKKFLISVMLKKLVKKAVHMFIAFIAGLGLQNYGIGIEINQVELTAGIFLGMEALRNFLKVKYPKYFSWM